MGISMEVVVIKILASGDDWAINLLAGMKYVGSAFVKIAIIPVLQIDIQLDPNAIYIGSRVSGLRTEGAGKKSCGRRGKGSPVCRIER